MRDFAKRDVGAMCSIDQLTQSVGGKSVEFAGESYRPSGECFKVFCLYAISLVAF